MNESKLKEAFLDLGAIWPIRVISEKEASTLLSIYNSIIERRGAIPPILRAKPHLLIPELWELVRLPQILDVVEVLLGTDILCFGTSFIAKPAQSNFHVSWHQDATHWNLKEPKAVTVWLALSESTIANGCVRVLAKSHKKVVAHSHPEDFYNMLGRKEVARVKVNESLVNHMELSPGEVSIHDVLTIHGSLSNNSDRPRIGFAMRYIPAWNKQCGDGLATATLVRGTDRGHYELEVEPETFMGKKAMMRHGHILRCGYGVIYR